VEALLIFETGDTSRMERSRMRGAQFGRGDKLPCTNLGGDLGEKSNPPRLWGVIQLKRLYVGEWERVGVKRKKRGDLNL